MVLGQQQQASFRPDIDCSLANRYEQLIGQLNLAAHLPTDLSCSSATRCQIEVYLYIKLCCKSEDDSEECSYLEDFYDEDDEPQDIFK